MSSYYKANLLSIKHHHPLLFQAISQAVSQAVSQAAPKLISCRSFASRSGDPTLEVEKENRKIMLHSRNDPLSEAMRWAESNTDGNEKIIFLFGFGLGYHTEELLKKNKRLHIVVFEPSVDIFIAALSARDLSAIIGSERVSLLLGKPISSFDHFSLDPAYTEIKFLSLRSYRNLFADTFRELKQHYLSFINQRQINTATIGRFDRLWTKNTFKNSSYFFTLPGIDTIRDQVKNAPALILCAGPSVEDDIDTILSLMEKVVIIAVDTAMEPLIKRGIIPDFVVTVDPQYINSLVIAHSHHSGMKSEELPILVADPAVYPSTLRDYNGITLLSSSVFAPGRVVERFSGIKGPIAVGGSVAIASYDLARIIGANPIVLLGLDLSYSSKSTHLQGSFHETYLLSRSHRFDSLHTGMARYIADGGPWEGKDKSGNPVLTDRRMMLYKSWFESQAAKCKGEIYNASRRGLDIGGIENRSLEELKTVYFEKLDDKKRRIADLREKLKNTSRERDGARAFISYLKELDERLQSLLGSSRRGKMLVGKALSIKPKEREKKFADVAAKLDIIDREILSYREENQLLNMVMQTSIMDILKKTQTEEAENALENSKTLYLSIEEGAGYLSKLVKISLKNLNKSFPQADKNR